MGEVSQIIIAESYRDTAEYLQAKRLLAEKKVAQGRIREIDRQLRRLWVFGAGATNLANEDLERVTRDFSGI